MQQMIRRLSSPTIDRNEELIKLTLAVLMTSGRLQSQKRTTVDFSGVLIGLVRCGQNVDDAAKVTSR